jgi:CO dehydrogenase maturation factor
MATTIAISGKGGSGKTTLAAMIIRLLSEQTGRPILAVDADPNSCLGLTMGVQPVAVIAEVREKAARKQPTNPALDRVRSLEYDIQQAITEADGFDLLTMGRPEGPGCYCAANNLLREFLNKLSSAYEFVVIDNEAGMEHLSRRTTNNVDLLCIVAEVTPLGAVTTQRIFELAGQLPISVKNIGVIWNRTDNEGELDGIDVFGCVPYDKALLDASMRGETIFSVEGQSPALLAVGSILEHNLGALKNQKLKNRN